MSNALEIKDLTKRFSDFTLDHIDLTLPSGCIMGLIGENGAGKSTLLKLILGLMRPDAGEARILGSADLANSPALKEHIGVVMDESCFPENLTLRNIAAISRRCFQTWDDNRFSDWIKCFELPEKKMVKAFSRGMKMKLSIAVALSHDSHLLLLDEATSGLDPIVRDELLDVLLDFIQEESHSILLSSHIVSDLEKICDYITLLHHGRILFSRPKDELLESHVLAKGSDASIAALPREAVIGVRRSSFGAEALIRRDALPDGMSADKPSLEDIMLFFGREER